MTAGLVRFVRRKVSLSAARLDCEKNPEMRRCRLWPVNARRRLNMRMKKEKKAQKAQKKMKKKTQRRL